MRRFLLLLILLTARGAHAQTPEIDWVKFLSGSGDDDVYSIAATSEGYVYCLINYEGGLNLPNYSYFDSYGWKDIAVVKLNRYGDFMWGKKIGGTGNETAVRLHLLSNDNVLIVGSFQDTVDFDPDINSEEIRVSVGSDDCFALILDENGGYLGAKTFGGSNYDILFGIDEDHDQNIWLSGRFEDSIDVDSQVSGNILYAPNGTGTFILKLDQQLNLLESISFHAKDYATIYDLDVSRNGQIHFTGYFDDTLTMNYSDSTFKFYSNGLVDCFYSVIDTGGNFIEHTQIGGNYFECSYGLTECHDGNYMMQIMYEDSLPLTINNELVLISGNKFSPVVYSSNFIRNTAIVKLNGLNVKWCKTINSLVPGGLILPAADPVVDSKDNVYFVANYRSQSTVNQSGFNIIGQYDTKGGLLLKLNSEGEFTEMYTINGSGDMFPYCMYLDDDDLFIAGESSSYNDFDFTEGIYYGQSAGGVEAKYNLQDSFLFTDDLSKTKKSVYPNPANQFLILSESDIKGLAIQDLTGREIHPNYFFNGSEYQINTTTLLNGTYVIKYEKSNSIHTKRFVVQH